LALSLLDTEWGAEHIETLKAVVMDKGAGVVANTISDLRAGLGAMPDRGLLLEDIARKAPEALPVIRDMLPTVVNSPAALKAEFDAFVSEQRLRKAFFMGLSYLEQGQKERAIAAVMQAANNGHNPAEAQYEFGLERTPEDVIPTGIAELDNYLTGGGLARGRLGIILAGTSVGKSTMLVNLLSAAMIQGFTAVHITLEDSLISVSHRYDLRLGMAYRICAPLYIKEYGPREASIHQIMQQIRAKNWKPDIIAVDYLDIVKSGRNRDNYRWEIGEIADGLRRAAKEFNCVVWSAKQASRTARHSAYVTSEQSMESYEPIQVADCVLCLSQTLDERAGGTMRIYLDKQRDGKSGVPFRVNADFTKMLIGSRGGPDGD
jgi:replicative DNA helicase